MVVSCCAVNCSTRYLKGSGVSFFRFPANDQQRRAWINAVSREKWSPSIHDRLCEKHFVGKKPSNDPMHVDYFPTIFSDVKGVRFTPVKRGGERLKRLEQRKRRRLSLSVESDADAETSTVIAADPTDSSTSAGVRCDEEQVRCCLQDVGKY